MKLKYYMRGLGIGIILTTLVFTLRNEKEELSDKEIKQRAIELGMIDSESAKEAKLGQMLNETTGVAKNPTITPDLEPTTTPSPKPTVVPTPTNKPVEGNDSQEEKKITVTIKRGMSSNEVADVLENAGIIQDADDFNKYIIKVGKASVIRVGNYSIHQDASYDDIIKKITSK